MPACERANRGRTEQRRRRRDGQVGDRFPPGSPGAPVTARLPPGHPHEATVGLKGRFAHLENLYFYLLVPMPVTTYVPDSHDSL